jgi:hypothetical protein
MTIRARRGRLEDIAIRNTWPFCPASHQTGGGIVAMIMGADERTHPSLHQSIRNNTKHTTPSCRGLPLFCLICVMDIQDEDLQRYFSFVTCSSYFQQLTSLEGTRSQFGGHYCRGTISGRSPESTPRFSAPTSIQIHPTTTCISNRACEYPLYAN